MLVGRNAADDKTQLVDALGMLMGRQHADLAALGLAHQVSLLDARRIHEVQQMFGKCIEIVGDLRFIRVPMTEIIDRQHAKFFRQGDEIAHPGFGVPAAAVQKYHRCSLAFFKAARANSRRVVIALIFCVRFQFFR